jgi:hypothetical protein
VYIFTPFPDYIFVGEEEAEEEEQKKKKRKEKEAMTSGATLVYSYTE